MSVRLWCCSPARRARVRPQQSTPGPAGRSVRQRIHHSYLVVLLPEFEYGIERNMYCTSHRLLSESMLRIIYEMMVPWCNQTTFPVIDNSQLTIDDTAARLQVKIERLRAAP